jgi:hypothetical protein
MVVLRVTFPPRGGVVLRATMLFKSFIAQSKTMVVLRVASHPGREGSLENSLSFLFFL